MTTPTKPNLEVSDIDLVRTALESDYDVVEELGRGGMATVYRARERALDRDVAIKVLPFTLAFDDSIAERFMREARISARLEHPHIIPIYRVGQAGRVSYIVMKLLRGQSLSDRLRSRGPLSADETCRILTETGSALGYAHSRGVVHRDIKPDNILLDESGRSVLTDFGIARSGSDSKLTAAGMSVGTPRYMSPEQARAKEVDGRSDIYSLGVVGYECLTGHPPFDGGDPFAILMDHINTPVPPPALTSAAARSVYVIVERMLAKEADDRFASAEELLAALAGRNHGGSVRASTPLAPSAAHAVASDASPYGTLNSGPRSAAALDRALEAGFEMLKQQRPRVNAGLAATKRAIATRAPQIRSLPGRLIELAAPIRSYASANRRRFFGVTIGTAFTFTGLYYGAHFAIHHRSRCPAISVTESGKRGVGAPGIETPAAKAPSFSLKMDEVSPIRQNGRADVYYDVCGLDKGTGFTTRVTISRTESGLSRLFGRSVGPVTGKYEATARGPATRRHVTLDMDGMPGGAYWVTVLVTDERGRQRDEGTSLRVRTE